MKDKILTISIAAYNVEKFIEKTIESLLVEDILADIEVFIVDDGGKDNTVAIASKYENKYPDTFKIIKKENAGYGSTVNYSIRHATGRYFKLLDGDDWFDKDGLKRLVNLLKTIEADIVVAEFKKHLPNKTLDGIKFDKSMYNKCISLKDFKYYNGIQMHATTFKTSILRESNTILSEHIFYTDNEFVAYPLKKAKNIYISDITVYQYRIGQINQTLDINVQMKHIDVLKDMSYRLSRFYVECKKEKIDAVDYLCSRVAASAVDAFAVLVRKKASKLNKKELIDFDKKIFEISPDVFRRMGKLKRKNSIIIKLLRMTNYYTYGIVSKLLWKVHS